MTMKSRRTRGLWRSSAILGLVFLGFASAPSAQSIVSSGLAAVTVRGGVSYVRKNFTINRGQWVTFRVPCPSGTHVLGGGHYNGGGFSDVIGAHSYPYDGGDSDSKPDDGWAANLGAFNGSYPVTMYAMCANILPAYPTSTNVIPPRSSGIDPAYVPAICPESKPNVLSGGSRGRSTLQEWESSWRQRPVNANSDRWRVLAFNVDNEPRTLTTIAVCSALNTIDVTVEGSVGARSQALVTPDCSLDFPLVVGGGGGFMLEPPFATGVIAAMRPVPAALPQGGEWEFWVDNFDLNAQNYFGTVLCIEPLT